MESEHIYNPRHLLGKDGYFEQNDLFQYWNPKGETEYPVTHTLLIKPEAGYLADFNDFSSDLHNDITALLNTDAAGIALIGGAGTGKTHLLSSLAGYWISQHIYKPGEVLVITFTNTEIPELSEGILKVAKEKSAGVEVTGIEGFCLKLLSMVYGYTPRIFDSNDRKNFITLIFPFLSDTQRELLFSFIQSPGMEIPPDTDEDFNHLRDSYFHSLHNIGACDLGVLTAQTSNFIANHPGLLLSVRQKYRCILIDDLHFMDKNQYDLISQVIMHTIFLETDPGKTQRIVVSMDPLRRVRETQQQQICHDFLSNYIEHSYFLHTSWRVPGRILNGMSRLFRKDPLNKKKIPTACKKQGTHILLFKAKNPGEEADFITRTIHSYVNKKHSHQSDEYSWKDFGIFTRDMNILTTIIDALKAEGIPFSIYDKHALLEKQPFHIVYSFFHFLLSEKDVTAFVDILLNFLSGFSLLHIQSIFFAGNRKNESVTELVKRLYTEHVLSDAQYKEIVAFQKVCKEIKATVSDSGIISGVTQLCTHYKVLEEAFNRHSNEKQLLLKAALSAKKDIRKFLADRIYFHIDLKNEEINDKVQIASFHYVKDLSPSILFCPGMEEGNCPLFSGSPDMELEKGLFYSAMTRAQERVYLSCTTERSGEKMRISSFISEMGPHVKDIITETIDAKFEQGSLF